MSDTPNESLLDVYIFETTQNLEQIEEAILSSEESNGYTEENINEIFRHMHTIKGSSAMMLFHHLSTLAHSIEDLFFYIRENGIKDMDQSDLDDLILDGVDFIKVELEKIKNGDKPDGDAESLIQTIRDFLEILKQNSTAENPKIEKASLDSQVDANSPNDASSGLPQNILKATIFYKEGCEMENIRAFGLLTNLQELSQEIYHLPKDLIKNNDRAVNEIRENGFIIYLKTDHSYEEVHQLLLQTIFLKELQLVELEDDREIQELFFKKNQQVTTEGSAIKQKPTLLEEKDMHPNHAQSIISVNVAKLDSLMDLVGEMVIAEAMVTQNPDIKDLEIDNFQKAARQLHKITVELQDLVMSIRMVPLANTFHKMHRVVRDMSKKLGKEVKLEIIGEETEVDKNIIEHISDPLMHLVRNAVDHGIEATSQMRLAKNKPKAGTVTIEAKNAGNDVLILIKDDGQGLNKDKMLQKAIAKGLLVKPAEEMTDKEIYNLVFMPGLSTNEKITEFSGRGVGMDVVVKNIEAVGGTASIESEPGLGTTVTLKIPLTLAIIEGMNVLVGRSSYTIPITAIKESFKAKTNDYFSDPDGNEMIMVRGECYPILRLYKYFGVQSDVTEIHEGILIMVEAEEKVLCLFADELVGQQQVVVKTLPAYIKNQRNIKGISGCTLLGDGSISLILDIAGLVD
ncbi:chemotaxis protein CheA [Bacillus tuaregi]|uniref:chemotaxis protein CheA n=1 Tax=Bacillus tuaregi TaxID=1816695 RepID=UPI0008F82A0B|nr:chemotaxis protein CheA [Bacillus tuaregi]